MQNALKDSIQEACLQLHSPYNYDVLVPLIDNFSSTVDISTSEDTTVASVSESDHSLLTVFRSYRLTTYFRTMDKFDISSPTFSHKIDPHKIFCRFELRGVCNDEQCPYQHQRDIDLSNEELLQVTKAPFSLVSY